MNVRIFSRAVKITSSRSLWRNPVLVSPVFVLCLILAQTTAADNLLTNPDFESGTDGWYAFVYNFTTSATVFHSGTRSGYASGRTATWQGIAQSLLGKIQPGQIYTINAWIKLENAPSGGDVISATIRKIDDSGAHYTHVSSSMGYNDLWSPLSGQYTLTVTGTLTELTLYFEGPAAGVNYYLDDVEMFLYEPPITEPNATGKVDFGNVHQKIEGFGASGVWYENWITPGMPEPNRSKLYDTLFRDSGLDIYRVKNSYGYDNNYITKTKEIVQAAKTRNPSLKILCSALTPPAYLKSNNDINSYPHPGTLKKDGNGQYMYDAYADWWAASLTAFESNSIHLDYVCIQNEPDFEATYDSCKFLPTEDSNYAGYDQAQEHVYQKFNSTLGPSMPKLLAPDSAGLSISQTYINTLIDANHIYGFAHHLYSGHEYDYPDSFIAEMQNFAQHCGYKPLFQTEYGKLDGQRTDFNVAMNTARHIHNSFVYEGVCAYLYWELFWGPGSGLVTLPAYGSPNYTINPTYYAFKHYSAFTDPGWRLVGSSTDSNGLCIAAFKNPCNTKLTAVILNISPTVDVSLMISLSCFSPDISTSAIYQTTSDVNFKPIGTFNPSQPLLLPKLSITTITCQGTAIPDNIPPNADAGHDQILFIPNQTGCETVVLNGSGSNDSDGSIINYIWTQGGNSLATGVGPAVCLPAGRHTITLQVTDDCGLTGTDTVVIIVEPAVEFEMRVVPESIQPSVTNQISSTIIVQMPLHIRINDIANDPLVLYPLGVRSLRWHIAPYQWNPADPFPGFPFFSKSCIFVVSFDKKAVAEAPRLHKAGKKIMLVGRLRNGEYFFGDLTKYNPNHRFR